MNKKILPFTFAVLVISLVLPQLVLGAPQKVALKDYRNKFSLSLKYPARLISEAWQTSRDLISSTSFTDTPGIESNSEITFSVFDNSSQQSVEQWVFNHSTKNDAYFFVGNNIKSTALSNKSAKLEYKAGNSDAIKYVYFDELYVYALTYIYSEDLHLSSDFKTVLNNLQTKSSDTPFLNADPIISPISKVGAVSTIEISPTIRLAQLQTTTYKLPWKAGISHGIGQGWGGTTSHMNAGWYAYDFDLTQGEQIRASAKGTVTMVETGYTACGNGDYSNQANYIVINHEDGSATQYLHIASANVSVGQSVVSGQVIGKAGNVGWTYCSFQLHFQREAQGGLWTQSQSIYFNEYPATQLMVGSNYTSANSPTGSCGTSDVYLDNAFTVGNDNIICDASGTLTVTNSTVSGGDYITLIAGQEVRLSEGFHVDTLTASGKFDAHTF